MLDTQHIIGIISLNCSDGHGAKNCVTQLTKYHMSYVQHTNNSAISARGGAPPKISNRMAEESRGRKSNVGLKR